MIGVITVKVSAHSPQMPLCPAFSFKGSPSSLRIEGVPKSIGTWNITNVFAVIHYPDDVQITKEATRVGNVWVATFDGCATAGKVENGLQIVANGTDEQGNAVNGYVLGAGDIYVMEGDSVIPDPSTTKSYVKLCDTLPTTPSKGDAYFQNGVLVIYDGTSWVPACDISSLETQIAKKRDLDDFSIQGVPEGEGSWFVFEREQTDLLRFDWETSEWESDAGISIRLNTWEPGEPPYYMTDTEQETYFDIDQNGLGLVKWNGTWHKIQGYTDTIAKISQVPTKTSQLQNDSGFITSAQVPTSYDKIQDSNNNVINANRTVSYDVVSYHWRFYDGFENEYDFTGTKTNAEWQSGSDKMKLFMPDSSHWTLQKLFDLGGSWITSWSETIEGSEDDTSMSFFEHGYNGTWADTHTPTSGELVLKSYVDGLVGDINSVLDTINGEVI